MNKRIRFYLGMLAASVVLLLAGAFMSVVAGFVLLAKAILR